MVLLKHWMAAIDLHNRK